MQPYAAKVDKDFVPDYHGNIFDDIFEQYERVIVESLITSFGLDFIVKDQYGGDVDTILNVRKIGEDPAMSYKSQANKEAYQTRGEYDYAAYHGQHENYAELRRESKKEFQSSGKPIDDAYAGGKLYFYSRGASKGNADKQASIDHILTAHTIHNDPGRVLARLSGEDLANSKDNLVFTNSGLNSSMGATKNEHGEVVEIPEYIRLHPELPEQTKSNMMRQYNAAKASYEAKLRTAYYTSPRFAKDLGLAAANVGVRMGARQVLGFIFAEVWFAVKSELRKTEDPFSLEKLYTSIGKGVERGISNAKIKYKDLIGKFGEGITAGALSSLTTTLCNIFFTTAKHTVRIIRQSWASMVQATEIILFNPDDLLFGDRLCAATKILAVGGSVVVGTTVSELIAKTPVGVLPVVGDIVQTFCGTLVSGIMSCTLLCFIDRSQMVRQLTEKFNQIPTMSTNTHYFREQAKLFEAYAAELQKIDSQRFSEETAVYQSIANEIDQVGTEQELNVLLRDIFKKHHIPLPWQGDFSTFMMDKSQHLVYE
jgi:hypothetical protein